ncbi:uncharacterized protein LOC120214095 [Hibiscus syriacus]|uniref:uncharacterized protein LOC120214095 n=1 Tax=Hibiscus syriacus TaxID=106335 RepID=UPI001921476A|nr:uncharacterized protein LOC120214095 [Hibiscus syriacus]
MAELATERSRTNSPNRRFSFSLSRISRSFSFKESSAVPQLSSDYVSVRSGPMRSDSSCFLDDAHIEKLNGRHRTRSSPFRRVLDPLLKSKGLNSFRSTDTVQPSKGSLNSSTPRPLYANESFQEEKLGSSMTKALLEVAMKNGHPLFRFVVTNGSNMLATTVKSLASSDKVGSDKNYVFSSVSEIKKKSGRRISKGNKEKNCGYIYNIIGQLKISDIHISDLTAADSYYYHMVRESVLFSVEQRQADQALVKFTPSNELAAVIIKIPGESDAQQADKDGFLCNFMENSSSKSTTVILSGGVHSMPNKTCLSSAWFHTKREFMQFSSSITALQAFFIAVTVVSCWKSSDFPKFNNLKEEMFDGSLGMDTKPTIAAGAMPAKYAPNPPHSPAGRV